ncbi:MAG: zinc ribbon domain-containing protein [Chloroflexota bacterium]|jgi:hypothetical protein|nr:zinc ribbon domain-containing protein [Chloroflexota bacterium]
MIVICPDCGAENSLTADVCQECGASLLGVIPSPESHSPEPEEEGLDLLVKDDSDLPDLLNALKQEEDVPRDDKEEDQVSEGLPQKSSKNPLDFDADGEEIPEWLKRIRKRAREEKDSVGEITQKINTAKERAEGEKSNKEHNQYESYLKRLRGQTHGIEDQPGEHFDSENADSDWISRIKKAEGKDAGRDQEDEIAADDRQGDSLLQWLVTLEDGGDPPRPLSDVEEEFVEKHRGETLPIRISSGKPELESTQQIDRGELKFNPPELSITREEQVQADQLAAIIVDERASRPERQPKQAPLKWVMRLVLGIILIAGLSFPLFPGGTPALPQGLLQPHNEAFLYWAREVPAEASLLLVFDYAAGYAGEISLVASPVLNAAIKQGSEIAIVSSAPSGSLLAKRVFSELETDVSYEVTDYGYFPISAFGAYGIASGGLSEDVLLDVPEMGKLLPADGFDGVLILSDSFEGAQVWIEQLSSLIPETPLNLLVTAQAGPMLLPYWESGQVNGMVSGLSQAAGIERALSDGESAASHWRSYQIGLLILIAVLVIGAIFNTDTGVGNGWRGE